MIEDGDEHRRIHVIFDKDNQQDGMGDGGTRDGISGMDAMEYVSETEMMNNSRAGTREEVRAGYGIRDGNENKARVGTVHSNATGRTKLTTLTA